MISVVITTFGNNGYLQRSLQTVKNQTYKDIEIIVVDGKNDNQIKELLNGFGFEKSTYIGLEKDQGTIFARNTGCKSANGEFIALLDDDDEWEPTKLEEQMKVITPNVGLITCYSFVCYDDYQRLNFGLQPKLHPTFTDLLKGFEISPTSSFLVKTSLFKDIGYFSDVLVFPEYDVALKIAKTGAEIICVPKPLMFYHQHAIQKKSYSKKPINLIRLIELINFLKMYHKDFRILSFKEKIYNYIRLFVLFFFLSIGGILNQNTVVILERISCLQRGGA